MKVLSVFDPFPICENTIYIIENPARLPWGGTGRLSPSRGRGLSPSSACRRVAVGGVSSCRHYTPVPLTRPRFYFSFLSLQGFQLSRVRDAYPHAGRGAVVGGLVACRPSSDVFGCARPYWVAACREYWRQYDALVALVLYPSILCIVCFGRCQVQSKKAPAAVAVAAPVNPAPVPAKA